MNKTQYINVPRYHPHHPHIFTSHLQKASNSVEYSVLPLPTKWYKSQMIPTNAKIKSSTRKYWWFRWVKKYNGYDSTTIFVPKWPKSPLNMTGRTQYAYIPKHHTHLFTHTTFSGWALQAIVSWHLLTKWTQRQLQKFTYKNKSDLANIN